MWRVYEGKIESGVEIGEWYYVPIVQEFENGDRRIVIGNKATYLFRNGSILSGVWDSRYQVFDGPCVLQMPVGRLVTVCSGFANARFPFDGPGKFLPSRTNVDQELQDVILADGSFDYYSLTSVQTKEAGWLRRFGRELGRWGDDIGNTFEEFICGIAEVIADNCNINVAVHVTSDGDVTVGSFPGDKPGPRASEVVSEDVIRWFMADEAGDLEEFVPLWFDSLPHFGLSKLSSDMPQSLAEPAFPQDHVRPPTLTGTLRPNVRGSPVFGARRSRPGGNYVYHTGIDYWTNPGDPIVSPIDGKVLWTVENDDGLNTLVVGSDHVIIRILYVRDTPPIGTPVTQGLSIATAGNLSVRPEYHGVPNHVHMMILEPNTDWAYNIDGTVRIYKDFPYPLTLTD